MCHGNIQLGYGAASVVINTWCDLTCKHDENMKTRCMSLHFIYGLCYLDFLNCQHTTSSTERACNISLLMTAFPITIA